MNFGDYTDRVEIQERTIAGHSVGHSEVWVSRGVFNAQVLERDSALSQFQQQFASLSKWLITFPDNPNITYRYSRLLWKNNGDREFRPSADPKRYGDWLNTKYIVECEEFTYMDSQIEGSSTPSINTPPSTDQDAYYYEQFIADGSSAVVTPSVSPTGPVVVLIDSKKDDMAYASAGIVYLSYTPPAGAVIEVSFAA